MVDYRPVTSLRPVYRRDRAGKTHGWDEVVTETAYRLYVNGELWTEFLCLPTDLEYLALGHLALAGRIGSATDIGELTHDAANGAIRVKLAPGARTPAPADLCGGSDIRLPAEAVLSLAAQLPTVSNLFRRTGGVHTAGIAKGDRLLFFFEDTGRHNALDKIYGRCLLEGIPTRDKVLLFSGRATAKVVTKVRQMGIPVLVSRAATTSLALDLAEEAGITLVGFARPDRLNVYTHPERITGFL
ncbi:MAG: Formate dehydrogenase family accessory protein FdhD [Clostridia bacterium 62_21]|nr:MAG: Formate dehydrogenase family accessory protein FdhD [Clostridia bacterium 62_21]